MAIGLRHLLSYEANVEEDFCMTFQVSVEEFGQVKTHILKPNGENIPVTNENRQGKWIELHLLHLVSLLLPYLTLEYTFLLSFAHSYRICATVHGSHT